MESVIAGLEVFFSTVNLTCKEDAVVALTHWAMVIAGFQCIGLGDQMVPSREDVEPSEFLPPGWNNNPDSYSLKYIYQNESSQIFILKIVKSEALLLISALDSVNNRVVSTAVRTDGHINENFKNYKRVYTRKKELFEQINNDIVNRLPPKAAAKPEAQDTPRSSNERAEDVRPPPQRRSVDYDPQSSDDDLLIPAALRGLRQDDDPLAYGHGDLDPLGRQPGGMLMDPRRFPDVRLPGRGGRPGRGGGLPWGAIPPGARFDPFGPPVPDRDTRRNPPFGSPNPDHLPPPGYDDMFN